MFRMKTQISRHSWTTLLYRRERIKWIVKIYMSEVLPQKPSNYSEKEKLFDCTDINVPDVFESLIA